MNRRLFRRSGFSLGVSAFVGFAMFACSSSSNSGSGNVGDTSSIGGFINTYCSYVGSCCGAESRPSDGEQCRALLELAGLKNYDAAKGQACIEAVKTASASDPAWCVASPSQTSAACDLATSSSTGSAAPGAKCSSDSDCAPGPTGSTVVCNFSESSGSSSNEICTVETHGKAGDGPCFGTVSANTGNGVTTSYNNSADAGAGTDPETFCFQAEGVTCDQTTSKCVALAQVGDSCASTQCVTTAYCDVNTDKCVASAATGDACQTDGQCVSGDYCDTTANTCAAQGAQGAACTTGSQCTSDDCSNSKCGAGFGASFGLAFLCGGDGGS